MDVEIYTKSWCGYCRMAMALLDKHDIAYTNIDVTADADKEQEMKQRSGRQTVPQIFINDTSIGGFTDLAQLSATTDLKAYIVNATSQAN